MVRSTELLCAIASHPCGSVCAVWSRLLTVVVCFVCVVSPISFGQEWKRVAYLEFDDGTKVVAKEIEGMTTIATAAVSTEESSKVRTETKDSVKPDGTKVREVETTKTGTKKASVAVPERKTALLAIEKKQDTREDAKPGDDLYRVMIDDQHLMNLPEKDFSKNAKLARNYLAALKKIAKGVEGKPFVTMTFGDKERGFVVSHQSDSDNNRTKPLNAILWIKGRSFVLKTTPAGASFISDVATAK